MKRFLALALIALATITTNVHAQSYTQGVMPSVRTATTTVTNAAADTLTTGTMPLRNSVTFHTQVLKVSGDPEPGYVQVWGTTAATFVKERCKLLYTDTVRDVANVQIFEHKQTGNPYRHYMWTYNGVNNGVVKWWSEVLVR